MADDSSARERHFAAIEKKYGETIAVWLDRLAQLGDAKYAEQMALLQDTYNMSRTHANALVMTHRGSTHERRHADFDEYLASLTPAQQAPIKTLHTLVATRFPQLTPKMAYNQPMFARPDGSLCVGFSASAKHVSLNPFSADVVAKHAPHFAKSMVTAHTLKFALDAEIDENLIVAIVTDALNG